MIKDSEDFLKRLKQLREQIEKKYNEKTIEQIYRDVFELLRTIVGKKSQEKTLGDFDNDFVKKGKFAPQDLRTLKDIVKARMEFKKGKLNVHAVNEARKNASILINNLIEYNQRKELEERKNNK